VLVQPPDCRIAKQHATATVGLQAMLVGVNHDGIGVLNLAEVSARFFREVSRQSEIAAISGIGVDPETVLLAKGKNFRQGIHGAGGRRPHRRDHGSLHHRRARAEREEHHIHSPASVARTVSQGNCKTREMRWCV